MFDEEKESKYNEIESLNSDSVPAENNDSCCYNEIEAERISANQRKREQKEEDTYVYRPVTRQEDLSEKQSNSSVDELKDTTVNEEENARPYIDEGEYYKESSADVYASRDGIFSDVNEQTQETESNFTYSYGSENMGGQSAHLDDKETYYIKAFKKMKRFSIISVCFALVLSIAAISFAGLTYFRQGGERLTYFRSSNRENNSVSKEQFVPNGDQLATEEIAAKVGPAVVGIVNTTNAINFFNQITTSQSSGSGVIINENGYIVTNFHVIENANNLKVVLNTGKECETEVIGYDSRSDLAVLKIDEKDLIYATFGDSSQVNVGQKVIAIGNPLGTELMGTVTQGIVSAVNRTVNVENKTLTLLQTDAAINNGNSGGPLVNAYGEIIGINSVKMSATGVEGIGFAIPSNEVKTVVDDLINNGYVTGRLIVGVSGTNITEKLSGYYDLPVGFYVSEVYEGYGAYLAGVQIGDVIIKCDGQKVETVDDINKIRDTHKVNDTMEVVVWRNGKEVTLKVKLMEENPEITQ